MRRPGPLPSRRMIGRVVASMLSIATAVGLLVVAFPAATGARWSAVYDRLVSLSGWQLVV